MCSMLTIQIDNTPGTSGASVGMFAVADVLPITSQASKEKVRPITGLVVALGGAEGGTKVDVPTGEWLVRAKLPSGEIISQSVAIRDGEPASVSLQGQLAPSDELSMEFAAGVVPSARSYATEISKNLKLDKPLRQIIENFEVPIANLPSLKLPGLDDARIRPSGVGSATSLPRSRSASRAPEGAGIRLPDIGGLLTERANDRSFIKTLPRVAIEILEQEIAQATDRQLISTSFETVLAKLDIAGTEQALSTEEGIGDLALRLFGSEVERRPSELSGSALLKTTTVDLPAANLESANTWSGGDMPVRAFGWLRAAQDKTFVACIPHAWRVSRTGNPATVKAVVSGEAKDPSRLSLRIAVDDPGVASILGFLQSGDLDSAERLVHQSVDYLYEKMLNPYAAAAAAYALVHAPSAAELNEPWPQWVRNLSNQFPDIPDGSILLATWLLQRGAGELPLTRSGNTPDQMRPGFFECRKLLIRAVCCGPPIYRLGLRLLTENIEIVRSLEDELASPTKELERAAALARWMSLRVDTTQPFTVLRI